MKYLALIPGVLLLAATESADAQGFAGVWRGTITAGSNVELASLKVDSASAGWRAGLHVPGFRADTIWAATVTIEGDRMAVQLPAEGMSALLRGSLAADRDRFVGTLIVGADSSGTFLFGREGTPTAARLARLADPPPRRPHADPDSARLVTTDIPLFWKVVTSAPDDSLEAWLQRDYLEAGSVGLRDFIPGRILSASALAAQYRRQRTRYDSLRSSTERVVEAEPAIRKAFHEFKRLYPEAVFPDVYFVIGRFNSGGTASRNGLLIGAEMFRDPARLPSIVAHELIHFQQVGLTAQPSLLVQSFREGSADFVGEMIAGVHINNRAHSYGLAHERELWAEFTTAMNGRSYTGWMYGDPPGEKPADLGYFIGYRIAQAYYNSAADKRAALRDIVRGVDVDGILARSGYNP